MASFTEGPDTEGPTSNNPATRVLGLGALRRVPPLAPRDAFLAAYDRLATLGRIGNGKAMVVVAVNGSAQIVDSFLLRDRQAVVIGRHSQCGLRLVEGAISLRHLAALVRFSGGRPMLHLWDLATGQPFLTEDGSPNSAIVADGPVYVSVGQYAIWFVPAGSSAWPARADEAWEKLPPRQFLDRREPDALHGGELPPPIPRDRDSDRSLITAVGAPLLLDDVEEAEVPWGVLRTEYRAQGIKMERRVSAERLGRGVLVGRYLRCGVCTGVEIAEISRVHLLLVRIEREVWAIDTASTSGVWRADDQVIAEALADLDTLSLVAPDVVNIGWRRIEHPEA